MSDAHSLANVPTMMEGSVFAGKYRLIRQLGSGGMGTVWEGAHTTLATRVAIKFIKPQFAQQAEARARFEIEARAAAKLRSKHAVHVYDHGVSPDGLAYIVMEFLEGESLSDAILSRGPLAPVEVARVIGQAARALSRAHASGIVHRDLKPDNVFLARSDEPDGTSPASAKLGITPPGRGQHLVDGLPYVVKLVDFGIAKMFEEPTEPGQALRAMGGPTREGTVIGTPNFMAPEQLVMSGAPGPLTDLWSLGACTFAAMTGRLPFEGDVLGDIVLKVCAAPMPIPSNVSPHLPPGFDAWFARACSRDPAKRFQTAEELAQALAGVCGLGRIRMATLDEDQIQYVIVAKSDGDSSESLPVPSSMSPRTALLAGLVLGIAMMVGVLGLLAWRDHSAPPGAPPPAASMPTGRPAP